VADLVNHLVGCLGGEHIRVLLAGPAGVGKTQIACELASRAPGVNHIEHDALKGETPCSPRGFDPYQCFSSRVSASAQFVIDIGGGSVFRSDVDNDARLRRIRAFKHDYSIVIVLITANRAVVRQRFLSSKGGEPRKLFRPGLGRLGECREALRGDVLGL
jgi:predicted ABC-type ATPase